MKKLLIPIAIMGLSICATSQLVSCSRKIDDNNDNDPLADKFKFDTNGLIGTVGQCLTFNILDFQNTFVASGYTNVYVSIDNPKVGEYKKPEDLFISSGSISINCKIEGKTTISVNITNASGEKILNNKIDLQVVDFSNTTADLLKNKIDISDFNQTKYLLGKISNYNDFLFANLSYNKEYDLKNDDKFFTKEMSISTTNIKINKFSDNDKDSIDSDNNSIINKIDIDDQGNIYGDINNYYDNDFNGGSFDLLLSNKNANINNLNIGYISLSKRIGVKKIIIGTDALTNNKISYENLISNSLANDVKIGEISLADENDDSGILFTNDDLKKSLDHCQMYSNLEAISIGDDNNNLTSNNLKIDKNYVLTINLSAREISNIGNGNLFIKLGIVHHDNDENKNIYYTGVVQIQISNFNNENYVNINDNDLNLGTESLSNVIDENNFGKSGQQELSFKNEDFSKNINELADKNYFYANMTFQTEDDENISDLSDLNKLSTVNFFDILPNFKNDDPSIKANISDILNVKLSWQIKPKNQIDFNFSIIFNFSDSIGNVYQFKLNIKIPSYNYLGNGILTFSNECKSGFNPENSLDIDDQTKENIICLKTYDNDWTKWIDNLSIESDSDIVSIDNISDSHDENNQINVILKFTIPDNVDLLPKKIVLTASSNDGNSSIDFGQCILYTSAIVGAEKNVNNQKFQTSYAVVNDENNNICSTSIFVKKSASDREILYDDASVNNNKLINSNWIRNHITFEDGFMYNSDNGIFTIESETNKYSQLDSINFNSISGKGLYIVSNSAPETNLVTNNVIQSSIKSINFYGQVVWELHEGNDQRNNAIGLISSPLKPFNFGDIHFYSNIIVTFNKKNKINYKNENVGILSGWIVKLNSFDNPTTLEIDMNVNLTNDSEGEINSMSIINASDVNGYCDSSDLKNKYDFFISKINFGTNKNTNTKIVIDENLASVDNTNLIYSEMSRGLTIGSKFTFDDVNAENDDIFISSSISINRTENTPLKTDGTNCLINTCGIESKNNLKTSNQNFGSIYLKNKIYIPKINAKDANYKIVNIYGTLTSDLCIRLSGNSKEQFDHDENILVKAIDTIFNCKNQSLYLKLIKN